VETIAVLYQKLRGSSVSQPIILENTESVHDNVHEDAPVESKKFYSILASKSPGRHDRLQINYQK
jgi:hypothetical protein